MTAVLQKENRVTAQRNLPDFFRLMDMTDAEFKARSRPKDVCEALKVPKAAQGGGKNRSWQITTLRGIFCSEFDFLHRDASHVGELLLEGKVTCKYCYQKGAVFGSLRTQYRAVKAHAELSEHLETVAAVKARGTRQIDMVEAGGAAVVTESSEERRLRARTLGVGHLVAGGNGAGGVPHTAVPAVMSQDFLLVRRSERATNRVFSGISATASSPA